MQLQKVGDNFCLIDVRAGSAIRRNGVMERCLELVVLILGVPEFRAGKQRGQHQLGVAVGLVITLGQLLHQAVRWFIRYEVLRQLIAEVMCCRRMLGEHVQHLLDLLCTSAFDCLSEHHFVAEVVTTLVECCPCAVTGSEGARTGHAPAGKHARQFHHVLLCITAVHSQRVQLQKLTRIVFVDAALFILWIVGLKSSLGVLCVVQIEHHRRVVHGGTEQVAEITHGVRANRLFFIGADQNAIETLVHANVEVVEPEVVHQLIQLTGTFDGAHQLGFDHAGFDELPGVFGAVRRHALFGGPFGVAAKLLNAVSGCARLVLGCQRHCLLAFAGAAGIIANALGCAFGGFCLLAKFLILPDQLGCRTA